MLSDGRPSAYEYTEAMNGQQQPRNAGTRTECTPHIAVPTQDKEENIMKKQLSILCALLLACFAVAASAEAPVSNLYTPNPSETLKALVGGKSFEADKIKRCGSH